MLLEQGVLDAASSKISGVILVRSFLSALFIIVGVLLTPIALLSHWAENYLFNTQNFVALYQPLSGQAGVQEYLSGNLADAAAEAVETSGLSEWAMSATSSVDGFLQGLGIDLGLEQTASEWTENAANQVRETVHEEALLAVQSPEFSQAWTVALTQVHSQVMAGFTGDQETQILTLEAEPFVGLLGDYLSASGVPLAGFLNEIDVDVAVPLVEVSYPPVAKTLFRLVSDWGPALPWAAGVVLFAGVLLARRRFSALAKAGFGAGFAAGLLWLLIPPAGKWVLTDVAPNPGDLSVATLLWTTGTAPLQTAALLVAVGAVLAGAFGVVLQLIWGSRD